MNRILSTLALILLIHSAAMAQYGCKTFTRKDSVWTVCYFTTGQRSTEIYNLVSDTRWHTLKAYDKTGKVIYSREYGQRHGSSGVDLSYHLNGGIYTARYTMQPDGGIQHYDVKSFFTEEGKFDHDEDNSLGDNGQPRLSPVYHPGKETVQTPVVTTKTTPKPNECAPVPASTDLYMINYTSERLHVRAQYNGSTVPIYNDVDPSDTVKVGIYYGGLSVDPLTQYKVQVETRPKYDYVYMVSRIPGTDAKKQYVMVTCRKIRR